MEDQRFEELLIGELAGELTAAERQELLEMLTANEDFRGEHAALKDFWVQKEPDYADMRHTLEKIKTEIRRQERELELQPAAAADPNAATAPSVAATAPANAAPNFNATALDAAAAAPPDTPSAPEIEPHRRFRRWRTWSAAAALIALLGGYGLFHTGRKQNAGLTWQEKYTPRNARSRMTLTDGSSVTLNSDSRLKYPVSFDGPAREVYLMGEAYFTIAKDAAHPFIIHTNKMTIRVLGTSFDVRCYPDDDASETTLIQGSIEVTFPDRPADKIILKPTDKLVIRNDRTEQPANRPADIAATRDAAVDSTGSQGARHTGYTLTGLTYYRNQRNTVVETSWMDNKLVFNAEELQSVARKMERWYGVTIAIDNEELKTLPFTGLFQNETVDEALYALKLSEKKLHYTKKEGVIHIY